MSCGEGMPDESHSLSVRVLTATETSLSLELCNLVNTETMSKLAIVSGLRDYYGSVYE
jgi:hypothetical protein